MKTKNIKVISSHQFDKFISRSELNNDIDKIFGLRKGMIVKRKRNKICKFVKNVLTRFLKSLNFNVNNKINKEIEDELNKIEEIRKKTKVIF